METLAITKNISKARRVTGLVIGIYLSVFCSYFLINELLSGRHNGLLFYTSLIAVIFGIILIVGNISLSKPLLTINNSSIFSKLPSASCSIEWANVSRVNFGISYAVFYLNGGQKEQRLELSSLVYDDIKKAKGKITELCELKNIPYQND